MTRKDAELETIAAMAVPTAWTLSRQSADPPHGVAPST